MKNEVRKIPHTKLVKLTSVNEVNLFCQQASNFNGDVTVKNGIYVVNGKSILGVLSLDLTKDLTVVVEPYENTPEYILEAFWKNLEFLYSIKMKDITETMEN